MPYVPKTWANGSGGGTPILAADLNKIELGIKAAYPIYNLLDSAYGAVGNGVTDDTSAIQAAFAAAQATGGLAYSPPGYTYIISSTLTIGSSACTVDLNGSTIKKANSMTAQPALSITAPNVTLRRVNVDGNLAGGATGYGIQFGTAATGCSAVDCTVSNCAWPAQNGICWDFEGANFYGRNLYATNFRDTGIGFRMVASDVTLLDCHAVGAGSANSYAGWYVGTFASQDRFTFSGSSTGGGSFGFIAPAGGLTCTDWWCLGFKAHDMKLAGFSISGVTDSSFDIIDASKLGVTDSYPSGNGVEVLSCVSCTFGTIRAYQTSGYGLTLVLSTDNSFGLVHTDNTSGFDTEPGVGIQGSSHRNTFGTIRSEVNSYALAIEDDASNGASDYNVIDVIHSSHNADGALMLLKGNYNHFGRIISRNDFALTDALSPHVDPGILVFRAGVTNNVVEFLDHYNNESPPTSFSDPYSLMWCDTTATGNRVLGALSRSTVATPLTDLNGGNRLTMTEPAIDVLTYSTSITPNATLGKFKKITATNTTAYTINAPQNPQNGMELVFDIVNSSGGAMGTITWNAAFKLAGAFTNPANTKARTISFVYDGSNWVETNRAAADI